MYALRFSIIRYHFIRQSARSGATPAIAASAAHNTAEKAGAGAGIAHGAMHETFKSRLHVPAHFRQFRQGEFACGHNAGCALFFQQPRATQPCHHHLRARMQRQIRECFPHEFPEPQILNDDAVQARFIKRRKHSNRLLQLRFFHERVHGQIDFFSMKMRIAKGPQNLGIRQIFCIGTGTEMFRAQIDGVCARMDGAQKSLITACRSKQFRTVLFHVDSPITKKSCL